VRITRKTQQEVFCYNLRTLEWIQRSNSCIEKTQENSIKSSLQNSLLYILLQMVHARYCASYSKWPCVKHEANMWCPCCMMFFCSKTFYSLLSSPVINAVTTPSDVTDVTVWLIASNPNPRVLKIEKWKINKSTFFNLDIFALLLHSYYNLLYLKLLYMFSI